MQKAVVPIGASSSADGRSALLRLPASVTIPTTLVPRYAYALQRTSDGRSKIGSGSGILRTRVASTDATGSTGATYAVTAKVLGVSSILSEGASSYILGTVTSTAGVFTFPTKLQDLGNIAGVVFDVHRTDSSVVCNVAISPSIDGFEMLSPSAQTFDAPTSMLDVTASQGVITKCIDLGGTNLYSAGSNGELRGGSLRVNNAVFTGSRIQVDDTIRFEDSSTHSDGSQMVLGCPVNIDSFAKLNTSTIVANQSSINIANGGAVFSDASNVVLGPVHFGVISTGVPAIIAPDVLSFDGRTVYVYNTSSTQVFVGSFTGAHICQLDSGWKGSFLMRPEAIGMLVCATGQYPNGILQTKALPSVAVCSTRQNKAVFGIAGKALAIGEPNPQLGGGLMDISNVENITYPRIVVISLGESAVWALDTNGNIEVGDYIQSSSVIGFGERQTDNHLRVYTVAKSTSNVDFYGTQHPRTPEGARSALVCVTVHCG
jgi:hypothetical protein